MNEINQGCTKKSTENANSYAAQRRTQKSDWASEEGKRARAHAHTYTHKNLEAKLIKWLNWFDKSRLIGVIRSVDISFWCSSVFIARFNSFTRSMAIWSATRTGFFFLLKLKNNSNLYPHSRRVCPNGFYDFHGIDWIEKSFVVICFAIWIYSRALLPRLPSNKEEIAFLCARKTINCTHFKLIRLHIGSFIFGNVRLLLTALGTQTQCASI